MSDQCLGTTKTHNRCTKKKKYGSYCHQHSLSKVVLSHINHITKSALDFLVELLDPIYENQPNKFTKITVAFNGRNFTAIEQIELILRELRGILARRNGEIDYFDVQEYLCSSIEYYTAFKDKLFGASYYIEKLNPTRSTFKAEIEEILGDIPYGAYRFIEKRYIPYLYTVYPKKILDETGYSFVKDYLIDLKKEMKDIDMKDDKALYLFIANTNLIANKIEQKMANLIKISSEITGNYIANDLFLYVLTPMLQTKNIRKSVFTTLHTIEYREKKDNVSLLLSHHTIYYIEDIYFKYSHFFHIIQSDPAKVEKICKKLKCKFPLDGNLAKFPGLTLIKVLMSRVIEYIENYEPSLWIAEGILWCNITNERLFDTDKFKELLNFEV